MSEDIRTVAVVGAGVMGQGIAQLAAQSGHRTLLFDVAPEAVDKARQAIDAALSRRVNKGRVTEAEARQVQARLHSAESLQELGEADLVIEAVVEKLDVKHELVRQLEAVCSPETLICSNTSSLSITSIAAVANHPGRVAGLHFFNPAPVMKLVEVVLGEWTGADVAGQLTEFAAALGKTPVRVKDSPGFIVNRCARPYYSEALVMLEQGLAEAGTIDACLKANAGMPLGPFELMDLIGLDVSLKATETIWRAFDHHPRFEPSETVRQLVRDDRLGRKTGVGFYRYPRDTEPSGTQPRLASSHALAAWLTDQLGQPVRVSDGHLAEEYREAAGEGCLVLDQSLVDWREQRVVLAYTRAGLSEAIAAQAEQLAREQGIELSAVPDSAGLIVQRTVAMLYDEAARARDSGVAGAGDIDTAMRQGLNFSVGPFALAEALGADCRQRILERLARTGPEGRYSG